MHVPVCKVSLVDGRCPVAVSFNFWLPLKFFNSMGVQLIDTPQFATNLTIAFCFFVESSMEEVLDRSPVFLRSFTIVRVQVWVLDP